LAENDTESSKNVFGAAISYDVVSREDAADHLRNRARDVLAGVSGAAWDDPGAAGAGANIAATVLTDPANPVGFMA
jgi:hypothetical protein